MDEARRSENVRLDLYPWKSWPHFIECFVEPLSYLQSIGPGELLDDEQDALLVVHDSVPDQRLVFPHHLAQVAKSQWRAIALCPVMDRDLSQVLRPDDGQDVLHPEPLIRRIDKPANPGLRCVRVLQ